LLPGVVFAGVGAGIAGVGILCLVLMHVGATSATAWIVFGLLAFGICAATWLEFVPVSGVSARRQGAQPAGPSAPREATVLVFAYAALGFGYIIPATFLPAMARELVRDPVVFGWSWPVFGAAAAASTITVALLPRSIGNRRILTGSLAAMALGVALPVVLTSIAGILVSAIFVGGTFMVATMAGLKEARESASSHPARLMAAMTAAFAAGQIAGPLAVTLVAGAGGRVEAVLLMACALLMAGACALMRPKRG
jgi:MFS family permease